MIDNSISKRAEFRKEADRLKEECRIRKRQRQQNEQEAAWLIGGGSSYGRRLRVHAGSCGSRTRAKD